MSFDDAVLDYSSFICFRLSALARRISREHAKVCSGYGITGGQSFILFDVLGHEGTNLSEIAARVQLDNPAVSGYVERLVKENLLVRIDDPSDRRLYRIYLTDKGTRLAEELLPKTRAVHNRILNLVDDRSVEFREILTKLEQDL